MNFLSFEWEQSHRITLFLLCKHEVLHSWLSVSRHDLGDEDIAFQSVGQRVIQHGSAARGCASYFTCTERSCSNVERICSNALPQPLARVSGLRFSSGTSCRYALWKMISDVAG